MSPSPTHPPGEESVALSPREFDPEDLEPRDRDEDVEGEFDDEEELAPEDDEFDDEYDDEYDEESGAEEGGRGVAFFIAAAVVSVIVVALGIFGLSRIVDEGYLDQFTFAFQDTSLLPEKQFRRSAAETSVRIFFTHDGRTLSPHTARLRRAVSGPEKARLILQELFSPPRSALFRSALPEGTRALGFYRIGSTAYLDLSSEFFNPASPGPLGERVAVYALVNSIVLNDPEIDAVQLMSEGKAIETAWGWLDCSSPLGANLSVIE